MVGTQALRTPRSFLHPCLRQAHGADQDDLRRPLLRHGLRHLPQGNGRIGLSSLPVKIWGGGEMSAEGRPSRVARKKPLNNSLGES